MYVKKSNGSVEEFDIQKVTDSICHAYETIGEECNDIVLNSIAKGLHLYDGISTLEIRRQIEDTLMDVNKKVARAFSEKYVENKDILKKQDFIMNYIKAKNAATGSKFDSNANVTSKNVVTMGQELYKENNIKHNRYIICDKMKKLYSKKLSQQYLKDLESHILYKHDETGIPGMPYTYSAKETVEVKYKDRHLYLPFDLLWDVMDEEAVMVNEADGVWQKHPEELYVKDKGNAFTHVTVMTKKVRKRDLVRVKTAFGEDVIVTDNHPMIIDENDVNNTVEAINSEGQKQFKIGEELQFDGKTAIDMSECPDLQEITDVYCVGYSNQPFKRFLSVDAELGYLVGFFVGDGNYNISKDNGSIVFTQKDRNKLVQLNNILFKKLGIVGNIRYKRDKTKCYNLTISNNALWWLLSDVFEIQDKSENKTLPYNFLEYNEQFAKGLLGGLIDADGTVNDCQLHIRLSSRAAIMQTTALLRHFGYGVGNTVQNLPFSNNDSYNTNYTLWGVNCSVRPDSEKISICDKLRKVRVTDSSLKYKKDGETSIKSVEKISEIDSFLKQNEFIYDITTDTRTFALNNILVHNCVAITMYPFLVDGLTTLGGQSTAPTDLKSFCGEFINLVYSVSSQFMGACMYKDQEISINEGNGAAFIKAKDFVEKYLGDKPLTFENYQGEWEYALVPKGITVAEDGRDVPVKKVYRRRYFDKIYEIISENGIYAQVSKDHRFKLVLDGRELEVKASELREGDTVRVNFRKGAEIYFQDTIKEIKFFTNDDAYVYEIETESHWYNCGGFITHNCATPEFLMYMDYFIRKDYGDDYLNRLDEVVEKTKKARTLTQVIDNGFQQVVHSMNMPAGNRG